ncbi:T9SS type A sorting domain-containing protein [Cytophagaceae bacterium DM2B3-1]|uniref:T9SS type A sorting domain-containing protein n=1 Tax=Xanthocytophaga flava TaxID=3048013 RepID=A0ABT7CTE4_9BACT|nr:T9SS type A sorting domain-containing protein [Xanthocytophaga flavus]MDJ1497014.1 T9SS type A sorting domain-containing protein [Xanthocytophaga flavus]
MKHLLHPFLFLIICSLLNVSGFAQTYSSDSTFQNPLVKNYSSGIYSIVVQEDQKILICGYIDYINNHPSKKIVRLLPNGSIDNTFQLSIDVVDSYVLGVRTDGKILVGEKYYNPESQEIFKISLLNPDGSLNAIYDTNIRCDNFNPNNFIVRKDQSMILGANTYNKTEGDGRVYRLRADGSIDPSFTMTDVKIYSISALAEQPDGKIVIVGYIKDPTESNDSKTRIIRLNTDGSWDSSFVPDLFVRNQQLFAVVVQNDGKIVLGGNGYQSPDLTGVSRLNSDGSLDRTFKAGNTDTTYYDGFAVAIQHDGKIVAKTWHQSSTGNGQILRFMPDGSLDPTFHVGIGAEYLTTVLALQKDGKVLSDAFFNTYGEAAYNSLIRLNENGTLDNSFNLKLEELGNITALTKQSDGKLLLGGYFHVVNTDNQSYLTRLNPNGHVDLSFKAGIGLDEKGNPASGFISKITVQNDNKIWVGGRFSTFNGQKTGSLIRLNPNGTTDLTFESPTQFTYDVYDIVIQPDKKILVGAVLFYPKDSSSYLIRLNSDGSRDSSFDTGTDLPEGVYKIKLQNDGKIIVLQNITQFLDIGSGSAARRVIRLNPNGSLDTTFTPYETQDYIGTMELLPNEQLLINGSLTVPGKTEKFKLLRLNTNGSIDTTFNLPLKDKDYVGYMAIQPDGKTILAGSFSAFNQSLIRLQIDGSIDSNFVANTIGHFESTSLVLSSGDDLFLVYDYARVMKLIPQKPLGTEILDNSLVKLYPNPALGHFAVEVPTGWNIDKVFLYNSTGKIVPVTTENVVGGYQIHTGNLPSGLYILKAFTAKGTFSKRVILH